MEMAPGSKMEIGAYTLVCQTFTSRPEQNYTAERATIEAPRNGQQVMMLYPSGVSIPPTNSPAQW